MLEKITEMIVEKLDADAEKINRDTKFKEDLEIDSLDLFDLVMAVEDEFNIEIPSEELEKITTVGALVDFIESKQ